MIEYSSAVGLLSFGLITGITPGPNNLLLAYSGANFGIRKSLPHFFGTVSAFGILLIASYVGVGQLLLKIPTLSTLLLIICSGYLCYLAVKIYFNRTNHSVEDCKPLTYFQGFFIQFINPKLWMVALASFGFIRNPSTLTVIDVIELITIMVLVSIPAMGVWLISGSSFQQWMQEPHKKKWFNGGLSCLTLLTIPILWLV